MVPPRPTLSVRWRRFLEVAPARVDHIPAFRIALGLAGVLAVLLALGRPELCLYGSFGAFTGIYSRYESTRRRFRRQSLVGLLLTGCVMVGVALSWWRAADPGVLASAAALIVPALVAGASATIVTAQDIRPRGAIFPALACGAVAAMPAGRVSPWLAIGVTAAAAAWCVLLGLAGHWLGERHAAPGTMARSVPAPGVLRGEMLRYSASGLIAGVIAALLRTPSMYWAQSTAMVPLAAPGYGAQAERGLHRVIGTLAGLGVTAFLLSFPSQPWQLAVWAVVMQFLTELYVLRHYSIAMLFITPLVLITGQIGHPRPVGPMLRERLIETLIGVAAAAVVVGVQLTRSRRIRRRARERSAAAREREADQAEVSAAGSPDALR